MEKKQKQVRSKKSNKLGSVPLVSLTTEEVRRTLKPHPGFEPFAPELVALYQANRNKLALSDVTGDDITDALAAYQALRAEEVDAEQQLARVQESRLYYASLAYVKMLEIYNRCQRVGRNDADIKRAISAFEQFMKHGKRKPAKAANASASTASSSTSASTPTSGSATTPSSTEPPPTS